MWFQLLSVALIFRTIIFFKEANACHGNLRRNVRMYWRAFKWLIHTSVTQKFAVFSPWCLTCTYVGYVAFECFIHLLKFSVLSCTHVWLHRSLSYRFFYLICTTLTIFNLSKIDANGPRKFWSSASNRLIGQLSR